MKKTSTKLNERIQQLTKKCDSIAVKVKELEATVAADRKA